MAKTNCKWNTRIAEYKNTSSGHKLLSVRKWLFMPKAKIGLSKFPYANQCKFRRFAWTGWISPARTNINVIVVALTAGVVNLSSPGQALQQPHSWTTWEPPSLLHPLLQSTVTLANWSGQVTFGKQFMHYSLFFVGFLRLNLVLLLSFEFFNINYAITAINIRLATLEDDESSHVITKTWLIGRGWVLMNVMGIHQMIKLSFSWPGWTTKPLLITVHNSENASRYQLVQKAQKAPAPWKRCRRWQPPATI